MARPQVKKAFKGKAVLRNWTVSRTCFGAFRLRGDLFPGGEKISVQVFAISHGRAFTDIGKIKLCSLSGKWTQ